MSFEIIKLVMALGLASVVLFFGFMLVVVAGLIWRAVFPMKAKPPAFPVVAPGSGLGKSQFESTAVAHDDGSMTVTLIGRVKP